MKCKRSVIAGIGFGLAAMSLFLPRIVSRFVARPADDEARDLAPNASLDVIIPSYLESSVIESKILGLRESLVGWPGRNRVIVVASDEETAAAASMADVVLRTPREGKAAACNRGIAHSDADVVVLTDANCEIVPVGWPKILREGLEGWDLVSANKGESGGREAAFWAAERTARRDSPIGTLSVAGEFMGFRRLDYSPIPTDVTLDDLAVAMSFERRGKSCTVSNQLQSMEPAADARDQWERRVRMSAGLLREILPQLPVLAKSSRGRLLIAHKLYRQTVGCLGFWLFILAVALTGPVSFALVMGGVMGSLWLYRSNLPLPRIVNAGVSAVAMQCIPVAAVYRLMRSAPEGRGTWRKVPR